jgi:alkyl hydroperoxide reductase subunit AhpC
LGLIDFHEWIGDKWAILFSHPEDYTPVCTTELAALAKYEPEFTKRGVKLIGLSANTVETHGGWINDIDGEFKSLHVYYAGSRESQKEREKK